MEILFTSLMGDPPMTPHGLPPAPPSPPPTKSNLPMLYYGLAVVATAAVILAVYNLLVLKWSTHQPPPSRVPPRFVEIAGSSHCFDQHPGQNLLSSFKYKKAAAAPQDGELECAVCLSVVEDGEELRQLPRCKHSFHVSCIDMWLYSHSDCPLCRAPAVPPPHRQLRETTNSPENSRDGLLPGPLAISY